MATQERKPTSRQLNYLRTLANQTGQTFTYPRTISQASAEIQRLKTTPRSSRTEVRIEHKLIADQIAAGPADSAAVRPSEIVGYGSSATWNHNRPQELAAPPDPEAPQPRRKPAIGQRTELARYSVPDGDRIVYGQRVDGMVRFLPGDPVVLDAPSAASEDSSCRPRNQRGEEQRPDASRQKRPNDSGIAATTAPTAERRGRTGDRVELARYTVSAGERALYGQRILGVVRVTDVPLGPDGRSYLVERELELDGHGALKALVADYLRQARLLDAVPMATVGLSFVD